ncbi:hypothetical protein DFR67_102210 [Williamsia limnetica]|uniref:Transmembrane protein n=1 Tax=Williamsia limnetica TaxID=882452 RepID=A0A318RSY8_WILLI|nr:hypothetical protein [Williamsia limnetica]PYE20072.1 hypothetical protein DFR67_102210 [Williamsia limnetica]
MARGSDPDSRPISVAELLARAKEAGATDVAEAAAGSPAATGRRHRGGKDGISVAELTGEIPRIAEPATPPPTRDFNSAAVSERAAASPPQAEAAETKPTPAVSADSAKPDEASSDRAPAPEPEQAEPQATKSTAADSDQHSDSETTGVIASVQAYSQVDDNDPNRDPQDDHRVLSAAERDREFEAYRNFEDVDATPAPTGEPKKKRGILGFGRKKAAAAAPSAPASPRTSRDQADDTDHEVTQLIPTVTATPPTHPPVFATDGPPPPVPAEIPEPAQSPAPGVAPATPGRYLRFDVDEDSSPTGDVAKGAAGDAVKGTGAGESNAAPTQADTRVFGAFASSAQTAQTPKVDSPAETPTAKTPTAKTPAVEPSTAQAPDSGADAVRSRLTGATVQDDSQDRANQDRADQDRADHGRAGQAPAGDLAHDDATPAESAQKSPSVQWLLLIGQVLAGLAVGVALFWGFTELWRWNVYFALILAVAVIFGLVTLVHVVRKSQDLISTLLALGVGLLVTIGPLVLLLVAGD